MNIPWQIEEHDVLPSTNDLAIQRLRAGEASVGDVIVAGRQTAGRGREKRVWRSDEGALLMTAVLPLRVEEPGWGALAAGLGVARVLRRLGVPVGLKWPNDLILEGRKLGGILVELAGASTVPLPDLPGESFLGAVGIGINLNNRMLHADGDLPHAVSLYDYQGSPTPVGEVLEQVLASLADVWAEWYAAGSAALVPQWEAFDVTCGRRVVVPAYRVEGVAQGLHPNGGLRVCTDAGAEIVTVAGEVNFL